MIRITHPDYFACVTDWQRWRDAYTGGPDFVRKYLRRYSLRESTADFNERLQLSYCPRFAGAGIDEVKNSIAHRFPDISRIGGSPTYVRATAGQDGGVDNLGNSMNSFLSEEVLVELLLMKRVGIFVDMPVLDGPSQIDALTARPYVYRYSVEDIINWVPDGRQGYNSVFLRDHVYVYDDRTGFPLSTVDRYRHLWKESGFVWAAITDEKANPLFEPIRLNLTKIPFVCLEISNSLMQDIVDYQIALLNLASSDMSFATRANHAFYIEQYDPRAEGSPYLRNDNPVQYDSETGEVVAEGTPTQADAAGEKEVRVGQASGRRYPINTNAPAFIHPSSEPMKASMDKQEVLKSEIRLLLNLNLSNIKAVGMASAESKKEDNRSLESGLANIGITLQKAENQIAEIWAMYEGTKEVASIAYPLNWSLKSEEERRAEAKEQKELMTSIPAPTFQKEMGKSISRIMLGHRVPVSTLQSIDKEIEAAVNMVSDPEIVALDVENGLVSPETASRLRGYPEGEAAKAEEAHARRAARIAEAQAAVAEKQAARGVSDMDSEKSSGREEKKESRNRDGDVVSKSKVRGKGKKLGE